MVRDGMAKIGRAESRRLRMVMLGGFMALALAACETVGGISPTGIAEVDDPTNREAS